MFQNESQDYRVSESSQQSKDWRWQQQEEDFHNGQEESIHLKSVKTEHFQREKYLTKYFIQNHSWHKVIVMKIDSI